MGHRARGFAFSLVVMGLGGVVRPAEAQQLGRSAAMATTSPSSVASGMYSNPYANPYANPFLNPYMTQGQVNGNAALYFLAAQQANGGIGSGRISGVRPGPRVPVPAPAPPDDRRVTDIPGGTAARYFNRASQPTGASRYFHRAGRGDSSARR